MSKPELAYPHCQENGRSLIQLMRSRLRNELDQTTGSRTSRKVIVTPKNYHRLAHAILTILRVRVIFGWPTATSIRDFKQGASFDGRELKSGFDTFNFEYSPELLSALKPKNL